MTTSTSLPGADQPNKIDLSTLQTESRNPRTTELDVVSTLDMCREWAPGPTQHRILSSRIGVVLFTS
jgi:hypothetical protein